MLAVSRDTGERAVKLFGHSALGWGAHIREFLRRPEAAAMRLVCAKLCETVDGRWTFPWVRWLRGRGGDGEWCPWMVVSHRSEREQEGVH